MCAGATLNSHSGPAIRARNLEVTNTLILQPKTALRGDVDLTDAEVGELDDNATAWEGDGCLQIDGFKYDRLGASAAKFTVDQRLNWIRRQTSQGAYAPQPYAQLAQVYKASGNDDEVRETLIAKQDDLRKHGSLSRYGKAWNWLLALLIGHGYRPRRGGFFILAIYLVTVGVVWYAKDANDFVAVDSRSTPAPASSVCTSAYPCVSPLAYPVDAAVPLINLYQLTYWQPDASRLSGKLVRAEIDIATILGWTLTTLLAPAYPDSYERADSSSGPPL